MSQGRSLRLGLPSDQSLPTWITSQLSGLSGRAFSLLSSRRRQRGGSRPSPGWAGQELERPSEKSRPQLGWPRTTDSLCPECVKAARAAVLSGEMNLTSFMHEHPGILKAEITARNGEVWMDKTCPVHGAFEDILSIDEKFLGRIEELFPGRDLTGQKTNLRDHGPSTIQYGRGSVLTVDLTNRCNMMCDPCFMDANQVGYVHELSLPEVKKLLDDAVTIKPRRQLSVQFSGGEPTLHPDFLDAVRYAREVGYFSVQCASNGIRFAESLDYAIETRKAGLRICYLQFDGVTNEANSHRKIKNLFDVKLRAIENLAKAGIDVVLVVTVVGGLNDDQVGPVVQFAIDNIDKVTVVSFQPVSFTGRDEEISPEERKEKRYTLSHLARDVRDQLGMTEPGRDWFPLSSMNSLSDVVDLLQDPSEKFGALNCGCHPNCGIGTILLVNKRTRQTVPLAEFLDIEQILRDFATIAEVSAGRKERMILMGLSLLKNFRAEKAPAGYGALEMIRQALSQMGAKGKRVGDSEGDAADFEWRFLFVAGMWFQDVFNYDFRRTEMCIIPYATQLGEISFCAYNTGVGFRQVVEKMYQTASVADWYKRYGRHPVFAKGRDFPLPPGETNVVVRAPRRLPLAPG